MSAPPNKRKGPPWQAAPSKDVIGEINGSDLSDYPPTSQLDWMTWQALRAGGVSDDMLLPMIGLRVVQGRRDADGWLEVDPAGERFLAFYEEPSDDVVFWCPDTGAMATWRGRAFALGEENIADPGSYMFDTSLYVHGSPWAWLHDKARGIVVVDWSQAFHRLHQVPRLAVAESVLPIYRKAMRPTLPELFVVKEAA